MRGLETDHVISGLDKKCMGRGQHSNIQTYGHFDSKTDPGQRAESVKKLRPMILSSNGVIRGIEDMFPLGATLSLSYLIHSM